MKISRLVVHSKHGPPPGRVPGQCAGPGHLTSPTAATVSHPASLTGTACSSALRTFPIVPELPPGAGSTVPAAMCDSEVQLGMPPGPPMMMITGAALRVTRAPGART
eukprot:763627-Hanusia_phi.AAC.13